MHDGRSAGVQQIVDSENNVKLSIELLKVPGGLEGGSWAARISGEPVDPSSFLHPYILLLLTC
jgi:mannosyl-oligosaccharide glucosidase